MDGLGVALLQVVIKPANLRGVHSVLYLLPSEPEEDNSKTIQPDMHYG